MNLIIILMIIILCMQHVTNTFVKSLFVPSNLPHGGVYLLYEEFTRLAQTSLSCL